MTDEQAMALALAQARRARRAQEVPIGCVILDAAGQVLATGHNLRENLSDPTAHAEIVAIRRAARATGDWRLTGTTLYVTLEPCPMCAGAILNARIPRVVYGIADPKAGCCGTLYDLTGERKFNHHPTVQGGVLAAECAALLQSFFLSRR